MKQTLAPALTAAVLALTATAAAAACPGGYSTKTTAEAPPIEEPAPEPST